MDSIDTLEKEVDNVAPKIVGILRLSEACDSKYLRNQMVDYCVNYMDSQQSSKNKKKKNDGEMEEDDDKIDKESPF
jgi:hypothetical protein